MPEGSAKDVFDTLRIPIDDPAGYNPEGASFSTRDAVHINCYPQGPQGASRWLQKRPGCTEIENIDLSSIMGSVDSNCQGNITITSLNDVYVAAMYDQTNSKFVICEYRPITGTTTKIGEITGCTAQDDIFLTELVIADVATLGVIWNKADGLTSKGYYATSVTGTFPAASLTEITDVNFPPKDAPPLPLVGGMVQMNGTIYVLTNTGKIANSDLNSVTSWNGLGVIQAISYPDQGVRLMRYKNHIVCFGEDSIEFFNDIGNPAPKSPLQRTDQAFIKMGAKNARSIVSVDDTLYWIGRSTAGGGGLWKLDGYTPVKLSSVREDAAIDLAANTSLSLFGADCLTTATMLGEKQIFLGGSRIRSELSSAAVFTDDPHTITATDLYSILVYNIPQNSFWGYNNGGASEAFNGVNDPQLPWATAEYSLSNLGPGTQIILFGGTAIPSTHTGRIYYTDISSNVWVDGYNATDDTGYMYPMLWQSNQIMFNNERRKRIHKFKVISDYMHEDEGLPSETGAFMWLVFGRQNNQLLNPNLIQRYIDIPNTVGRYYYANLGAMRSITFAVVTKTTMPVRVRGIEIDFSQGI